MSRENFRREISREFDLISGTPSPALSARVRSALAQDNPPRSGQFWVAGLAVPALPILGRGLLARGGRLILPPQRDDLLLVGAAQGLVAQAVHAGVGVHRRGVGPLAPACVSASRAAGTT